MTTSPERPTFRERGHLHRADTCDALVAAVRRRRVRLQARVRGSYPGDPLPARALPRLKSVGYWDADHDQDWGLDWHRNEGLEITYLASGRLDFAVEGRAYTLQPGSLTVTRPWQPHRVGRPHVGPGRLYWIILDLDVRQPHQAWQWPGWILMAPADRARLTRLLRHNEQPVWPGCEAAGPVCAQIGRVLEQFDARGTSASRLGVLINELLLTVLDILRARRPAQRPELTTAQRTTELFLRRLAGASGEPWTLEAMAAAAGLKRTRFAYYVRRLTNMTPQRYLQHLRLEQAKALLRREPGRDLTDIALAAGFSSGQHFTWSFRQAEGRPPGEWRRVQGSKSKV